MSTWVETMTSRLPPTLCHVLAACSMLGAMQAVMASDPVAERVQGFKSCKQSLAAAKEALARGHVAAMVEPAESMASFAARIPSLYPPGSTGGAFSRASGEIWNTFTDFEAMARTFQAQAQGLADLAASGTADQARLAHALGKIQDSCRACHRSYKRGLL